MEIETLSDKITSSEDFSNKENKICMTCKTCFNKIDSNPSICEICSRNICESCSTHKEYLTKQCNSCTKYISFLYSTTFQRLKIENILNKDLSASVSKFQEEIKGNQGKLNENSLESTNMNDQKTLFERFKQEILQNSEKMFEMMIEISLLSDEKTKLDILIVEKNEKIDQLSTELLKTRTELLEYKNNLNVSPQGCGELYLENFELKAKIKEIEQDYFNSTHQIIEALELLKFQLTKEKNENIGLIHQINNSNQKELEENIENERKKVRGLEANNINLKELEENLENERTRIRELEEELRITKEHVQVLNRNKNDSTAFEQLGTEKQDDPAGIPCKCIIY